jgi:hypothetical protein
MNRLLGASAALLFGAVAGFAVAARAADEPPPWAYGFEAPLDNTTLYTLPGSKFSFTQSQIFNRYDLPGLVAKGPRCSRGAPGIARHGSAITHRPRQHLIDEHIGRFNADADNRGLNWLKRNFGPRGRIDRPLQTLRKSGLLGA